VQVATGTLAVEAEGSTVSEAVGGPTAQAVFQTDAPADQVRSSSQAPVSWPLRKSAQCGAGKRRLFG
jgi:hypothetical protein